MNKKIILAGLLTLASVAGVVGTVGNAHKTEAKTITKGTYLYLKPNSYWNQSGARFAAYFFTDGSGSAWYSMHDYNRDGVYECKAESNWNNVIFCRMDPANNTNAWGSQKWNQTGNLTWDGSKNLYTMNNGSWDTGTWGTHTPTQPSIIVKGDFWNDAWDGQLDLTFDSTSSKEAKGQLALDAGDYELKITENGTWLGNSGTATDEVSDWAMESSKNDNLKFKASGGTYEFKFNYETDKLTITRYSFEEAATSLNTLISNYTSKGKYVKNTTINLNETAMDEMSTLTKGFHANANELVRTTYYSENQLWMSKTTKEGTTAYSYYGTDENGNLTFATTNNAEEIPSNVSIAAKYETRDNNDNWHDKTKSGMDGYYVTLGDIVAETNHKWSKIGNVYSCHDVKEVEDWFKAFTAPCYLGFKEGTTNYIAFTSCEIEEVNGTLVLRMIATGDTGKLIDGTTVFSQAVISLS